jgi:carbohydrate kinase (thermoresistant glucokinase family)
MGVSGSGKTTVGEAVARRFHWNFLEGDVLHPPANLAKMSSGQPLDDSDRAPWLAAIAAHIDEWRRAGQSGVVSCSALKRKYRDVVVGDRPEVRLVYLEGSREVVARRLADRRGHFMPSSLLDSQLATIEPPGDDEDPIVVSIDAPIAAIVDRIVAALSQSAASVPAQFAEPAAGPGSVRQPIAVGGGT